MLWMLLKAQNRFKTSALQRGLSWRAWRIDEYQNLMGCTNVDPLTETAGLSFFHRLLKIM